MVNFKLFYCDKVKSGLNFRPLAVKCCNSVLAYERYPYVSEASVTLVSDGEIRALNKQYRGIDKATDVLSFSIGEVNPDSEAMNLGDIVISSETAAREANGDVLNELCFLTVHGMFHLLGYDHMNKADKDVMFKKQEDVTRKLGLVK